MTIPQDPNYGDGNPELGEIDSLPPKKIDFGGPYGELGVEEDTERSNLIRFEGPTLRQIQDGLAKLDRLYTQPDDSDGGMKLIKPFKINEPPDLPVQKEYGIISKSNGLMDEPKDPTPSTLGDGSRGIRYPGGKIFRTDAAISDIFGGPEPADAPHLPFDLDRTDPTFTPPIDKHFRETSIYPDPYRKKRDQIDLFGITPKKPKYINQIDDLGGAEVRELFPSQVPAQFVIDGTVYVGTPEGLVVDEDASRLHRIQQAREPGLIPIDDLTVDSYPRYRESYVDPASTNRIPSLLPHESGGTKRDEDEIERIIRKLKYLAE